MLQVDPLPRLPLPAHLLNVVEVPQLDDEVPRRFEVGLWCGKRFGESFDHASSFSCGASAMDKEPGGQEF
jgi:hypothetical protein